MSQFRSTFLAGVLFGFVVGLAVGHLTIWRVVDRSQAASSQLRPVQTAPWNSSYELGPRSDSLPFYPEEYAPGIATLPATTETEEFEPIEADSPLANAIAIRTVEMEDHGTAETPKFELDQIAVEEPQPLAVPEAIPIRPQTPASPVPLVSDVDPRLRKVIEQELADIPPAQREVWLESLAGMSIEDATGVLRMWKAIGGQEPGLMDLPLDPSLSPTVPDPPAKQELTVESSVTNAIQKAIEIHRQNLLMSSNLGYLRMVPRFVEEHRNGRAVMTGVVAEIDFGPGPSLSTGNPLDLRIEGAGMFLVHNADGTPLLTRRGRFSLNQNRQLALIDDDQEYILQPIVQFPEKCEQIMINWDGRISVISTPDQPTEEIGIIRICPIHQTHELRYYKNGLIRLAEGAEPPTPVLPGNNIGRLQSGSVEVSNVSPAKELEQIQRFQSEIKLWQ